MSALVLPTPGSRPTEFQAEQAELTGHVWPHCCYDFAQCVAEGKFKKNGLLTRLREGLARARVNEITPEYRSICRHLRERSEDLHVLPDITACTLVEKRDQAPAVLRAPVVVERVRMWPGRRWNSVFWRREFGEISWKCRVRAPLFENDSRRADSLHEVCSVSEYVDYMHIIQMKDPKCDEENAIAFPRVTLYGCPIFYLHARSLFESCWRDLPPPGVRDYSLRWLKRWSSMCEDMPCIDQLARFHKITFAAAGSFTRLHRENFNAHVWFTQIEGSRLFFLFPPGARSLYEETGSEIDPETIHDHAERASHVDVLYPNERRHPLFREASAKCAILDPGMSLVVPCGWWFFSFALESSVTLQRVYWNVVNRGGLIDALKDIIVYEHTETDVTQRTLNCLQEFYQIVMSDGDPEDSDSSG